jgi:hypothetical protein
MDDANGLEAIFAQQPLQALRLAVELRVEEQSAVGLLEAARYSTIPGADCGACSPGAAYKRSSTPLPMEAGPRIRLPISASEFSQVPGRLPIRARMLSSTPASAA